MGDSPAPAPGHQSIERASVEGLTLSLVPANIKLYSLTEDKLENLSSFGVFTSLFLALFGIAAGCLTAFFIVLRTVDLQPYNHGLFIGLAWCAGAATLVCGAIVTTGLIRSARTIKQIKKNPTVKQIL